MSRIITRKRKVDGKPEEKDQGLRRLIWLLVFVVILLAVMLVIPMLQSRESKAEGYACTLSVRRAQDAILVEFLSDPDLTQAGAAVAVEKSKLGRDQLCPSGGDYYVVPKGGTWHVTCGLHEEDTEYRTQLNAMFVLEQVREQIDARKRIEMQMDNIPLVCNGQPLDVLLLAGDNGLRRGTDYSIDFDGVVSFYSMNAAGELNWFVYADANHAAVWKINDGWSGDAYPNT